MKLSCTDNMVPGRTLTEKADTLKNWGFDGIAIFMDRTKWNDRLEEEIISLHKKTGVKPCEFVFIDSVYGHLMDIDSKIKRQAIDLYKETICFCKEIGAITEMEYQYQPQNPLPLFEPYQKMKLDEELEFIEVVNELASEAEDSNAYILIEPCNRYETKYLTRLTDCKEILEKTSFHNTGILADFFHMAIEEADIAQSITNAGSLIRHVHLGDNNRLLPGFGHTDWVSAFQALKSIGFNGYMNLECGIPGDPKDLLPKTAQFLKSIIQNTY